MENFKGGQIIDFELKNRIEENKKKHTERMEKVMEDANMHMNKLIQKYKLTVSEYVSILASLQFNQASIQIDEKLLQASKIQGFEINKLNQ